jgi:hypothetical protein
MDFSPPFALVLAGVALLLFATLVARLAIWDRAQRARLTPEEQAEQDSEDRRELAIW